MGTQNSEKKYVYIGGEPIEVVESAEVLLRQQRRDRWSTTPTVEGFFKLWIGLTIAGLVLGLPVLYMAFN